MRDRLVARNGDALRRSGSPGSMRTRTAPSRPGGSGRSDRDASTRCASSTDVGGHRQMHGPAPALGRVHDLQVLDVHVALREDGGELRERAGAVGHGHLQHGDAGAHLRLGRQAQPGLLRAVERALHVAPPPSRISSRGVDRVGVAYRSIASAIASRFDEQDLAPQRRVRRRQPGEVAEPSGGQQQDLGLVGLLGGGQTPSGRSRPPAAGGSRTPRAGRGGRVASAPDARRSARPTPPAPSTAAGSASVGAA